MADQVRCGDGDVRQLLGHVAPARPVSGQSVDRQQPHRAVRAVAVHMQSMVGFHPSMVPAAPALVGRQCCHRRYATGLGSTGGAGRRGTRSACAWRLAGARGPGTGKTSLLVEVATAHVAAGVDANSVLLLTGSGRLPAAERGTLTATLLAAAWTRDGPGDPGTGGAHRARLRVRGAPTRRPAGRGHPSAAGHRRRTGQRDP